ncbi:hypothetical protein LOD99_12249 [Oopsacas minuta]|uniref:B9 domain-containing protein 1 n=1 Tax=Oopsacas minuta TaxID=111878 RepID=A0AAV7JEP2_9METZ|nr:hypothetical protein LOD99_12249 [Oopsacas minuta]
MAEDSLATTFLYTLSGEIQSGDFFEFDSLYCKYSFNQGQDWTLLSGLSEGITQISTKSHTKSYLSNPLVIWNFPLELTYSSTTPFGWPQIVLSVYGLDILGRDVIRGYGAIHLPCQSGEHSFSIPMVVPKSSTIFQEILGTILGRRAEFLSPAFIAQGAGREVTRVRSQGRVVVKCHVILRGFKEMGYSYARE